MTEERLIEVLSEAMSANGFGHIRELFELNKEYVEKNLYVKSAMEAMKQAVNESLDEAARIAMDNMLPKTSEEITNLKVK